MGSERKGTEARDWPHLLSVAAQVAALLGILVLGAWLETDAGPALETTADLPPLPPPAGYRAEVTSHAPPLPAPAPLALGEDLEPRADPARALAQRASRDAERLEAAGAGYTLQIAMLCDAERVEEQLARYGSSEELFLLAADHAGRLCFRLCWGHRATADEARRAPGLAASLREPNAFPTSVAAVLD